MSAEATTKVEPTPVTKEIKRKTLKDLFNEPCTVKISRSLMHQAFQLEGGGVESTLSSKRAVGLEMVFHPGYGIIGCFKGKYFLAPSANAIVAYE